MTASLARIATMFAASPGARELRRAARRLALVALVLVQIAISFHFADHLAGGDARAPECAICAVTSSGSVPISLAQLPALPARDAALGFPLSDAASHVASPAHFKSRAPPASPLI